MEFLEEAFASGHLAGDGRFSNRVAATLVDWVGSESALLTPSCTDALEMTAILCGMERGDEVIVPSFTFVSTANAFALLGIRPVFADVLPGALNIDPQSVAALITTKTRAVVVVHYGGVGCAMDELLAITTAAGIHLIEDNAHGLLGRYRGEPLGSFGALTTLSFHETKNFSCGEGGALLVNDRDLVERAEVIREKGTNRSQFFRGEVDKYTWVDVGSSYLLGEPLAAILMAQFEFARAIQGRRHAAWTAYAEALPGWASAVGARLPVVPADCDHPAHLYWVWMPDLATRSAFIAHMRALGIHAVFHYQALHFSPMGQQLGGQPGDCPVSEAATDCLVRLPLFSDITEDERDRVISAALAFGA
jgi:dTDP-4-amino-4,6-dideoxygalactose transaminase